MNLPLDKRDPDTRQPHCAGRVRTQSNTLVPIRVPSLAFIPREQNGRREYTHVTQKNLIPIQTARFIPEARLYTSSQLR